jgi:hypothetical protein
MEIIFTNTSSMPEIDLPQPAYKLLPNWYKELDSYIGLEKRPLNSGVGTTATIKKCMPVFDAMVSGYIITSPADVFVSILEDGSQFFEWSALDLISFHPIIQAPTHPEVNRHAYPKWVSPWSIRTPKGYSTLFVQPFHRESVFTILPGVVDTDEYYAPVNFPMVINDPEFKGLIPKGTPIVQVIPFKRDDWQMKLGGKEDLMLVVKNDQKLKTKFFDRYKNMFRQDKTYK